jgi:alkaline phosphatase
MNLFARSDVGSNSLSQRNFLQGRDVLIGALLPLAMVGGLAVVYPRAASSAPPKNVILMIADGSGANSIVATGMYTGKLGKEIYDGANWTKAWSSTYPLRTAEKPIPGAEGLAQDPETIYNSVKNWDTAVVPSVTGERADHFAGYRWNKQHAPDSANTMSAIVNGHKSYNNAINVDGNGLKLETFAERAGRDGKSVGVVTTVQISDATPAAGAGAHNVTRDNHTEIAAEMLNSPAIRVLMGTGNPDFDDVGGRRDTPNYSWISVEDWTALKAGHGPGGFALIQDKSDFEALVTAQKPPARLIGIAHSFNSTQANRPGATPAESPYSVPRKSDVPNLRTMVLGALNILDNNPRGMFLVIEGGAVDRAMHANNLARMIEERIEFDDAIAAVSSYLDANTNGNNWSNTLIIVTADHDHLLFGPDSDTVPFQELVDHGPGQVPGYRWQHNSHSNQLVPVYARGAGAAMVRTCATNRDSYTDMQGRTFGRGPYLDETNIFNIMSATGRC